MEKQQFLSYYNDLQASFYLHYKRTVERLGLEDIHQLRVTIKKLRILWSLTERASGGRMSKKEHQALTSRLFSSAGKVREAQLNLRTAKRHDVGSTHPYIKYMGKVKQLACIELLEQAKAFDLEKLSLLDVKLVNILKSLPVETIIKTALMYVEKETKKIVALKDQLPNNEKLHKIRTHLKNVGEILAIIEQLDTPLVLDKWQTNIKSLGQRMGKWHDNVVLLSSLENFARQRQKNTKSLQAFVKRIELREKARQKKIHHLINKYLEQEPLKAVARHL